jgi:hypothetical protein
VAGRAEVADGQRVRCQQRPRGRTGGGATVADNFGRGRAEAESDINHLRETGGERCERTVAEKWRGWELEEFNLS